MTLLVVIHISICAFLIFVILLQPGKADGGVTFGGSSSQTIFGSKGAGNFLTKTTTVCAVLFLVTSFILTRSRLLEYSGSVIKAEAAAKDAPKDAAKDATPLIPEGPKLPQADGVKDAAKAATPAVPAQPKK